MKKINIGELPRALKRIALMVSSNDNEVNINEFDNKDAFYKFANDNKLEVNFIAQTDNLGKVEKYYLVGLGLPSGVIGDLTKPTVAFKMLTFEEHVQMSKEVATAMDEKSKLKDRPMIILPGRKN